MNQKRNNDELLTTVFGSKEVLEPAPTDVIPQGMMRPEIAYQIVKDETYPQTQPRLNLATFVTTYMDEYATRLMNEAISVNYIDETEYPRIAVMNGRCINMIANLWNTPEKAQWKAGASVSALRRHVCWAVWPRGCAGASVARLRANRSTNRIW